MYKLPLLNEISDCCISKLFPVMPCEGLVRGGRCENSSELKFNFLDDFPKQLLPQQFRGHAQIGMKTLS